MGARTGFPVDVAVVVALDIGLNLLKLGVVAHATDALDAHLGQVVADGQQLILVEHEVAGVNCHVGGFAAGEAALYQPDERSSENTDVPKAVHTATGGAQGVFHRLAASCRQTQREIHVAALEDVRNLVDNLQLDGKRVAVVHLQAHKVVVAIRKPLAAVLPKLGPAANALVTTTIAFTMAGGGEAPNVIPREVWINGDMRCSHHQGQASSIAKITKVAKKFGLDTLITEQGVESGLTDHTGRAFRLVEEAVMATVPGVDACAPYIMTGASDSRYFGRVCDQCIRFLPFTISNAQMDTIHGINECLDLDTLVPAVDYYRYMLQHV